MYPRYLEQPLLDALADSPVVLLAGARQTGKTTLVRQLIERQHPARYVTLDDASFLSAARDDAVGLLEGLDGPVVIDEVQRAPELFPAIKLAVDRRRTPGRFLLTGSANVLLLPRLSESLAGRMEILTLWPLAQAEIENVSGSFVDGLFRPDLPLPPEVDGDRADLLRRIVAGGYPEPLARDSPARRRAWFGSYLTTLLQRDVRDLASIEGLTALPRLLSLLAARASSLLNLADLGRDAGLPYTTLRRYLSLLEATFLVQQLPAWSSNLGQRLAKAPKALLCDTGLAASLLGADAERLGQDGRLLGMLLENFVAMELVKDAGWSGTQPRLFHYRTLAGQEADLVLEDAGGRLVGIEVKASSTVDASDFRGLRALAETAGDRFVRGAVLYTGRQTVPFGGRLHALPVSALWRR